MGSYKHGPNMLRPLCTVTEFKAVLDVTIKLRVGNDFHTFLDSLSGRPYPTRSCEIELERFELEWLARGDIMLRSRLTPWMGCKVRVEKKRYTPCILNHAALSIGSVSLFQEIHSCIHSTSARALSPTALTPPRLSRVTRQANQKESKDSEDTNRSSCVV